MKIPSLAAGNRFDTANLFSDAAVLVSSEVCEGAEVREGLTTKGAKPDNENGAVLHRRLIGNCNGRRQRE